MIKVSSDFDPDEIMNQAYAAANEQLAQAAADQAIEQGVSSRADVDALVFNLSADSPSIDVAAVEKRAREILKSRLP